MLLCEAPFVRRHLRRRLRLRGGPVSPVGGRVRKGEALLRLAGNQGHDSRRRPRSDVAAERIAGLARCVCISRWLLAAGTSARADTPSAARLFAFSKRFDFLIEHLRTETAWRINSEGVGLLEAMLHACIDMDWLSCALALLHGKDPSVIGPISSLKGHLSSVG